MSPLQISLDLNSTHEQMLKQMQLKVFNWCKDHVSIPEPVENPWKKTTNTWTTWKKSPANMATAPIILFGWWLVWTGTFLCFDILRRITPTDFHIFQRGRSTTNQIFYPDDVKPIIIKYDTIHIYIYIVLYYIFYYINHYYICIYYDSGTNPSTIGSRWASRGRDGAAAACSRPGWGGRSYRQRSKEGKNAM